MGWKGAEDEGGGRVVLHVEIGKERWSTGACTRAVRSSKAVVVSALRSATDAATPGGEVQGGCWKRRAFADVCAAFAGVCTPRARRAGWVKLRGQNSTHAAVLVWARAFGGTKLDCRQSLFGGLGGHGFLTHLTHPQVLIVEGTSKHLLTTRAMAASKRAVGEREGPAQGSTSIPLHPHHHRRTHNAARVHAWQQLLPHCIRGGCGSAECAGLQWGAWG